jgi:hypothetical protein
MRPIKVWVGDNMSIKVADGTIYLSLDLYSGELCF